MEGFSDFILDDWDPFDLLTIRDAVLSENIPELQKNGQLRSTYSGGRSDYNFGHLIFEFLDHKFGRRGVKKFLFSLRRGGLIRGFGRGGGRNVLKVFDYTPKLFNHEFGKWARERFKKYLLKENPADYSYMIGPDFPYAYSFSHDISPSGEMLAVLTVNYKKRTLDIILISMRDGKVIKRITPGFTRKYDWINLKFNPTDGNSFAWNKDSNVIAFFARKEWTNYLVLINVLNGKIIKKIKIKDIQDPTSPQYMPGKDVIYFTGQEATKSYIYSMDLQTGKASKLTDGSLFIKALNISADGKKIAYSAKSGEYLKLYLAPIENPGMAKKITDGDYNDITPSFSKDGKHIFYSSDEMGSYNINGIDLESKTLSRYSDVRTGNFFPVEIPEEEGKEKQVVLSSFYRNMFYLYKKDITSPMEQRSIEFEAPDMIAAKVGEKEKKEKEKKKEEVKVVDKGKYKPFKKLYVRSLPPIGISLGTDGGIFGYSYLTLTDLLGDHSFTFYLYSYYGYRSYQLTYLNRRNRLNFYARLFGFKDVYYPTYDYSYYTTIRSMFGGEAGFFYPFNRAYRAEMTASLYKRDEDYDDLFYGVSLPYGQFFDGMASSVKLALVGETTRFQNYGPNRGHTFKISYEKYIKFGSNFMDAYTIEADFRKYIPLDNYSLLAFRLSGFKSGGPNAMLTWTGGDNNFRAADFRRLTGNNYFLFNAEFRFPIVHLALTPIGIIGPVRGVFFFDVGGIWYNEEDFRFLDEGQGLKLKDGRGSYGFGIEFFLFGYPMHVEWVWKTNLDKKAFYGVNFWIGFDF
jgi:WD40 repeat protein